VRVDIIYNVAISIMSARMDWAAFKPRFNDTALHVQQGCDSYPQIQVVQVELLGDILTSVELE